jgi:hypothetical protein
MSRRHPKEQAFEINRGGEKPRRTGYTKKRNLSAKLAADVEAFLANGGKINECKTGESGSPWNPAFNEPPEEAMFKSPTY